MTHKHIIELANGTPILEHKSGESEATTNLSYELVIEDVYTIAECPKPKELYGYDFCGHDALVSYINHLNL